MAGAFSCLLLAPISFAAWLNALHTQPSHYIANGLPAAAGVVLAVTAHSTLSEGLQYFFGYWRAQGTLGALVIAHIYFNWAFACGISWWRCRAET
jgi:hypothetical protein